MDSGSCARVARGLMEATAGGSHGRARVEPPAGGALRAPQPRLRRGGGDDARARHRRHQRCVQRPERAHAQAARVCRLAPGVPDAGLGRGTQPGELQHAARGLRGARARSPVVRGRGRVSLLERGAVRRGRAGARAGLPRDRRHLSAAGHGAAPRPDAGARRRRTRSPARGGVEPRPVAAALRRRPRRDRPSAASRRRPAHDRRRDAGPLRVPDLQLQRRAVDAAGGGRSRGALGSGRVRLGGRDRAAAQGRLAAGGGGRGARGVPAPRGREPRAVPLAGRARAAAPGAGRARGASAAWSAARGRGRGAAARLRQPRGPAARARHSARARRRW
jgi:hypothetical protein